MLILFIVIFLISVNCVEKWIGKREVYHLNTTKVINQEVDIGTEYIFYTLQDLLEQGPHEPFLYTYTLYRKLINSIDKWRVYDTSRRMFSDFDRNRLVLPDTDTYRYALKIRVDIMILDMRCEIYVTQTEHFRVTYGIPEIEVEKRKPFRYMFLSSLHYVSVDITGECRYYVTLRNTSKIVYRKYEEGEHSRVSYIFSISRGEIRDDMYLEVAVKSGECVFRRIEFAVVYGTALQNRENDIIEVRDFHLKEGDYYDVYFLSHFHLFPKRLLWVFEQALSFDRAYLDVQILKYDIWNFSDYKVVYEEIGEKNMLVNTGNYSQLDSNKFYMLRIINNLEISQKLNGYIYTSFDTKEVFKFSYYFRTEQQKFQISLFRNIHSIKWELGCSDLVKMRIISQKKFYDKEKVLYYSKNLTKNDKHSCQFSKDDEPTQLTLSFGNQSHYGGYLDGLLIFQIGMETPPTPNPKKKKDHVPIWLSNMLFVTCCGIVICAFISIGAVLLYIMCSVNFRSKRGRYKKIVDEIKGVSINS